QQPQDRGLARTARPDQRHPLAGLHAETQLVQHHGAAEPLHHPVEPDHLVTVRTGLRSQHGAPTSAPTATTDSSTAGRGFPRWSAVRRTGTRPNRPPAPPPPDRERRSPATAEFP